MAITPEVVAPPELVTVAVPGVGFQLVSKQKAGEASAISPSSVAPDPLLWLTEANRADRHRHELLAGTGGEGGGVGGAVSSCTPRWSATRGCWCRRGLFVDDPTEHRLGVPAESDGEGLGGARVVVLGVEHGHAGVGGQPADGVRQA